MSNATHSDTIFALASGKGRAGVAIVRISGPEAGVVLAALTEPTLPEPRRVTNANLKSPKDGTLIDKALYEPVSRSSRGHSYTLDPATGISHVATTPRVAAKPHGELDQLLTA